jgi:hypothetical protein
MWIENWWIPTVLLGPALVIWIGYAVAGRLRRRPAQQRLQQRQDPYRTSALDPAQEEVARALFTLVEPFIPFGTDAAYRQRTKQRCAAAAKVIVAHRTAPLQLGAEEIADRVTQELVAGTAPEIRALECGGELHKEQSCGSCGAKWTMRDKASSERKVIS